MSKIHEFAKVYEFTQVQQNKLRLQPHAYARLIRTHCETLKRYPLNSKLLLEALIGSDFYQHYNVGYLSLPARGVHGPFETDRMTPDDFVLLPQGQWFTEIVDLIQRPKWQLPSLKSRQALEVMSALTELFQPDADVYRLELCAEFNSISDSRERAKSYHHEWSHALNEFHEYVFVDSQRGRCDCLIFSYE